MAAAFTWLAHVPASTLVRTAGAAPGINAPGVVISVVVKLAFHDWAERPWSPGLSPARTVSQRRVAQASARPCDRRLPL